MGLQLIRIKHPEGCYVPIQISLETNWTPLKIPLRNRTLELEFTFFNFGICLIWSPNRDRGLK